MHSCRPASNPIELSADILANAVRKFIETPSPELYATMRSSLESYDNARGNRREPKPLETLPPETVRSVCHD